ncbi:MAG: enoyl-CoA hydratase/isomerase family protein [Minwuia sp.]|uniref:enoyl-CoA hydratase/isomerase family protein n=1 Tax=Minwuia sp. TaxID=2493630 RepID=UPI003A839117
MKEVFYECIAFERTGKILTVTLNRPDVLNAVNKRLHAELASLFTDLADDEAEVIVLTGAGKAFCAGGDIDWMQEGIDDPASFERTATEAKQIVFGLLDLEKPIICRMNGDAVGLGATIALFCDVIIAHDDARIGDPHVSVGLVAGDGGAIIWPQLIGYARAKEYLMTGKLMTARDAVAMGLINHAYEGAALDSETRKFAERLANGAGKAIRWTKVSVNIGLKQLAHAIMDASISYELMSNLSDDHQEAVNAFREKRRPSFTGR